MVTVAHIVDSMVEKKPFLEEAVERGLINYSALAAAIKPEIEKELKREVKTSAIMMALRRMPEKLENKFRKRATARFGETDITIKSGLFEMTVIKSAGTIDHIQRVYSLVDFSRGDFLTVTHGLYEITIIASRKYKARIGKILESEKVVKTVDGLSSLTVKIPVESIETVGLFYLVTKALNWDNINIVEIVSTLTEMTFILREDDLSRAFCTIKGLVERTNSSKI